jgi:hypothetical protein
MSNLRTQKVGRPSVVDEKTIRQLEAALCSGFSVTAACHFAGIGTSTFYEHRALDEDFAVRMKMSEEWATYRARQVILQAIDKGEVKVAMWFMERKARLEFAPPKPM